ncbi:glucan biosynthesis protein [Ruixingdingia sedimenti]|uniref:Glucan biosynthesis protein D n=1 Tax=Ruixingdingia sedimenti TaxID=3073604 RepID=A0ABU1FCI6_9RHOB|nr:glucan biosynthesis protein D [Xinfangfangia sp. LG-4]MDR5654603.1 glucan biosynthesis protein D [Xinfangfangia sp. LG-4]
MPLPPVRLPLSPRAALAALCLTLAALPPAAAQQAVAVPASAVQVQGGEIPFSFDLLAARAAALAAAPHVPAPVRAPEVLERIDYDAHWRIRFRPERTVDLGGVPVQLFHLGTYFRQPVRMFAVRDGAAREIAYAPDFFDMPADSPARALPPDAGFAGFRIMRPDLASDWISFLGAAYFRTDGAERQYGQSARAVAVDTGLSTPEEFPRFTEFYIEPAPGPDHDVVIHALLDGPRLAGAWRMAIRHRDGAGQVMDVESRLYFRAPVERLGIGPLTSMYWYSETNRFQSFDWRPEVHDTDGLMMLTGAGERIWRPLMNPDRVVTSSFEDVNPRGFGLVQRDRAFANYQDDGVFYDRRPAVWIEPRGDWGAGAVQLVEIPTDDEIYDNIVAFWNPAQKPQPGQEMRFDYRMTWASDVPEKGPVARTVATRIGAGGVPGHPRPEGQIKVVIDFAGGALEGLGQQDGVVPRISAPAGVDLLNPYALPIARHGGWRLVFDLKAPPGVETLDLRAYLEREGVALTETWLGQVHPGQIARLR